MALDIWKKGDLYKIRLVTSARLANLEASDWKTQDELISGLVALGCHQTDIGDALREADRKGEGHLPSFTPLNWDRSDKRVAVENALEVLGSAMGIRL